MDFSYLRVYSKHAIKSSITTKHVNRMKKDGCKHITVDDYAYHFKVSPILLKISSKLKHCSTESTLYLYKLNDVSNDFKKVLNFLVNLTRHEVKVVIISPYHMVLNSKDKNYKHQIKMLKMFANFELTSKRADVIQHRSGKNSNGGRPTRAHANPKKMIVYESIYNAYVKRLNNKHLHPKTYKRDVPYAPARMVSLEMNVARTTVIRIFKSLKNIDFHGKLPLKY